MDLPSEIYLKIFSYLNHDELSVVCMSVCRHWRTIAQDPSIWRVLKFQNYFNDRKIKAYLQLPFIWEVVRKLELVKGQAIPSLPIPNLQTLVVSSFDVKQDLGRVQQFPSLTKLWIKCGFDHDNVSQLSSSELLQWNLAVEIDSLQVRVEEDIANARKTLAAVRNVTLKCTVGRVEVQLNMYEESLKKQYVLDEILALVPLTSFLKTSNIIVLKDFSFLTHLSVYRISKAQAFQLIPATCPNLKYLKLDCINAGPILASALPFNNLEELNVLSSRLPEDELFQQVLAVWKNLKVLSVELETGFKTKLSIISKANPDLITLRLSISACSEPTSLFPGKVTFSALRTLEFLYGGYKVMPYISAPVLSSLMLPGSEVDLEVDLSRICPAVEFVDLHAYDFKTGVELLKPICKSLTHVRSEKADIFPNQLPNVQQLVDMCPGLTEIYLRVNPVDLEVFFDEFSRLFGPLKTLRTLRLWILFLPFLGQDFYKEQVELTDHILRNSFPSGSVAWHRGRHEVTIQFLPHVLRRNLAFHGFEQFGSLDGARGSTSSNGHTSATTPTDFL